jgi:hypothetical protein
LILHLKLPQRPLPNYTEKIVNKHKLKAYYNSH